MFVLGFACDSTPEVQPVPAPEPAPPAERASFKALPPPMAPAPEGAIIMGEVYVETCAGQGGCPALLQDAGAAHCAKMARGGLSWRLPSVQELERGVGNADLVGFAGFHWSGTPWKEDPAQFWMFDPESNMKTTAKPDRKPFTIRCAAEPALR